MQFVNFTAFLKRTHSDILFTYSAKYIFYTIIYILPTILIYTKYQIKDKSNAWVLTLSM